MLVNPHVYHVFHCPPWPGNKKQQHKSSTKHITAAVVPVPLPLPFWYPYRAGVGVVRVNTPSPHSNFPPAMQSLAPVTPQDAVLSVFGAVFCTQGGTLSVRSESCHMLTNGVGRNTTPVGVSEYRVERLKHRCSPPPPPPSQKKNKKKSLLLFSFIEPKSSMCLRPIPLHTLTKSQLLSSAGAHL